MQPGVDTAGRRRFGSRRRCDALVFICKTRPSREMLLAFIASAICHARTFLIVATPPHAVPKIRMEIDQIDSMIFSLKRHPKRDYVRFTRSGEEIEGLRPR
jgi:hypothetical protein